MKCQRYCALAENTRPMFNSTIHYFTGSECLNGMLANTASAGELSTSKQPGLVLIRIQSSLRCANLSGKPAVAAGRSNQSSLSDDWPPDLLRYRH